MGEQLELALGQHNRGTIHQEGPATTVELDLAVARQVGRVLRSRVPWVLDAGMVRPSVG